MSVLGIHWVRKTEKNFELGAKCSFFRSNRWWNCVPRSDDHIRWYSLAPAHAEHPSAHPRHLRVPRTDLQRPHCHLHLPPDQGALEHWRWALCRQLHRHRARLHQSLRRRLLRQRRHRHFRPPVHLLPVGEVRQDWIHLLGRISSAVLLLHGVSLGWLRVHHQPDPSARLRAPHHEPLLPPLRATPPSTSSDSSSRCRSPSSDSSPSEPRSTWQLLVSSRCSSLWRC
jgi:hypothetical protein